MILVLVTMMMNVMVMVLMVWMVMMMVMSSEQLTHLGQHPLYVDTAPPSSF